MEQGIIHAEPQTEKRLAYGPLVRKDLADQLGATDKNAWTKGVSFQLSGKNQEDNELDPILELRQEGDKIAVVKVIIVGYLNVLGE